VIFQSITEPTGSVGRVTVWDRSFHRQDCVISNDLPVPLDCLWSGKLRKEQLLQRL